VQTPTSNKKAKGAALKEFTNFMSAVFFHSEGAAVPINVYKLNFLTETE